jgi:hypothetical protein
MRSLTRLGVIAAAVLETSMIGVGVRADDPYSANQATERDEATTPTRPSKDVFEPGAASMEPAQATDEDAGTKAHQAWVESIHASL